MLVFACDGEPTLVTFDIRPVAPSLLSGSGKAGLQASGATGALVLEVSVRGPADEISRAGTDPLEPNLIWHVVEGDCASWREPGAASRHQVLYRWSPPPTRADAMDFRAVISRSDLDDLARPHALLAFRNGGGPLYACGDLPPLGR
nr:hypothetical protein [Candidatus Limnocylindria bacterium]